MRKGNDRIMSNEFRNTEKTCAILRQLEGLSMEQAERVLEDCMALLSRSTVCFSTSAAPRALTPQEIAEATRGIAANILDT